MFRPLTASRAAFPLIDPVVNNASRTDRAMKYLRAQAPLIADQERSHPFEPHLFAPKLPASM